MFTKTIERAVTKAVGQALNDQLNEVELLSRYGALAIRHRALQAAYGYVLAQLTPEDKNEAAVQYQKELDNSGYQGTPRRV